MSLLGALALLALSPAAWRQSADGAVDAAPHVSALAGLLASQGRSPKAIRDRILRTALDLGPAGHDPYYGKGRIRADLATYR